MKIVDYGSGGFRGQVSHFLQDESCELRVFALAGANATELDLSERARDLPRLLMSRLTVKESEGRSSRLLAT